MILLLNVKIPIGVEEIVVVVSAYTLIFSGVIPTNADVTRQERFGAENTTYEKYLLYKGGIKYYAEV